MKAKCPLCNFVTEDAAASVVTALLNIHALSHTPNQTHTPNPQQPKLERPRIGLGVEEEQWNNFIKKMGRFQNWLRDRRMSRVWTAPAVLLRRPQLHFV